jgi:hypothetical protein
MRPITRAGIAIAAVLCALPTHVATAVNAKTLAPEVVLQEQPFVITPTTRGRFVFRAPSDVSINRNTVVDIRVHRRIASRDSFQSIANQDVEAAVLDTFTISLARLSRTTNGSYVVTVPFSSSAKAASSLTIPFDGVYPVSVQLRNLGEETPLARVLTFVHKYDASVTKDPVRVSVAVRLAPTASLRPDGTLQITDKTRVDTQQFIRFVGSYSAPLTVSVQPELVAALASSTDSQDVALLAQLNTLLRSRTIATSAFASFDPSLFAAIGKSEEFLDQVRFGEATLNRILPGVPLQRGTWWATHPLSAAGVNLLRKAGIVSIVLSPAAQRGTSSQLPLGVLARPTGSTNEFMSVISVDAGVAQTVTSGTEPSASYRAVAELLMEREDLLASGVPASQLRLVLSTPTGVLDANGSLERAARQLTGLVSTDFTAPQSVNTETPSVDFPELTRHGGEARSAGMAVARAEFNATVSMADDADPRRVLWQSLLSLGESSAVSEPNEYIAGVRSQLASTRGAVTVTTPGSITLSGRQGAIRIQLRNDSDQSLTVKVRMASAKLDLTQPVRLITLAAGSTTEVEVAAGTRTNGRFPISVRVTTPEGGLEVVPYITITAKVNAIAGFGQLLSISLLLIILAWWWSHWRRSRLQAATATTVSDQ